jgi:hypothetical protein
MANTSWVEVGMGQVDDVMIRPNIAINSMRKKRKTQLMYVRALL